MAEITAIVCTRNRPDLIGDCLEALSRNSPAEVLVVDQSTDRRTADVVSSASEANSRVGYVPTSSVGLSRARNIGIRHASGEIVAFTDDDCVPSADWIESIEREFDASPEIAAVYGRSLPWNKVWPGERPVAVKTATRPRVFSGRCNPWAPGHGCNMAFRREVFGSVGLFDEALGPGGILRNCDDADFTYRLLRAGHTALYSPDVLVRHKQFRHGDDLWRLERDYEIGAGAFYSKHLRCGDLYMLKLILDRWWTAGVCHIIYGILTARKNHLRLGCYRIVYSALGMWYAGKVKISRESLIFEEGNGEGLS